jgi:hypothetical protein
MDSAKGDGFLVPTDFWRNRRLRMLPIWFFQSYLTLTVVFLIFSPWPWPIPDPFLLYGFLFFVQVALWLGYMSGIDHAPKAYKGRLKVDTLIMVSLIANVVWIVPKFVVRLGLDSPDPAAIIEAVGSGITDPGAMYLAKQETLVHAEAPTTLAYIDLAMNSLIWPLYPLTVVFWERMRNWMRTLAVCCIAADLMSWIAVGMNKGVADFVGLMPWLLLARNPVMVVKIEMRKLLKVGLAVMILGGLFIVFFSIGQAGRRGTTAEDLYDEGAGISADRNNFVMQLLPRDAQGGYANLNSYFVQGYYALSLALEEPFVFCDGVGNSYFLMGMARRFLGWSDILSITYPGRIEKYGWNPMIKWQTFYVWAASDVGFPGVLLVVFLIGRLFAKVWIDVLRKENPYAIVLFALQVIMLFYFSANNQVLATAVTAVPFWVFLLLWYRSGGRYVSEVGNG